MRLGLRCHWNNRVYFFTRKEFILTLRFKTSSAFCPMPMLTEVHSSSICPCHSFSYHLTLFSHVNLHTTHPSLFCSSSGHTGHSYLQEGHKWRFSHYPIALVFLYPCVQCFWHVSKLHFRNLPQVGWRQMQNELKVKHGNGTCAWSHATEWRLIKACGLHRVVCTFLCGMKNRTLLIEKY